MREKVDHLRTKDRAYDGKNHPVKSYTKNNASGYNIQRHKILVTNPNYDTTGDGEYVLRPVGGINATFTYFNRGTVSDTDYVIGLIRFNGRTKQESSFPYDAARGKARPMFSNNWSLPWNVPPTSSAEFGDIYS